MTRLTDAVERAEAEFTEYFVRNYPQDTLIYNPHWHAPKIFAAARRLILSALDKEGELTEALGRLISRVEDCQRDCPAGHNNLSGRLTAIRETLAALTKGVRNV